MYIPKEGQKLAAFDRLLLNTGSFHQILVQGTQKMWLLKTGDPLTEVAT